jgi:hypothetical protein
MVKRKHMIMMLNFRLLYSSIERSMNLGKELVHGMIGVVDLGQVSRHCKDLVHCLRCLQEPDHKF